MSSRKVFNYLCPRCGYETNRKHNMQRHFSIKVPCINPKSKISLTDEIKAEVLANRQYLDPDEMALTVKKASNSINISNNNTINNYYQLKNFVVQMEPEPKLTSVVEYLGENLTCYESSLEECFKKSLGRLNDTSFKTAYILNETSLLDCFNKMDQ